MKLYCLISCICLCHTTMKVMKKNDKCQTSKCDLYDSGWLPIISITHIKIDKPSAFHCWHRTVQLHLVCWRCPTCCWICWQRWIKSHRALSKRRHRANWEQHHRRRVRSVRAGRVYFLSLRRFYYFVFFFEFLGRALQQKIRMRAKLWMYPRACRLPLP